MKFQQPRLPLKIPHKNQKSEEHLDLEFDGLDDEDVNHETHIASNVDTLILAIKATSDITDQEEGLEKHSDLPACLDTSESDTTLDEAEIVTSTKATCSTCYFRGGLKRKTLPAESTATMVYCATHEYMIEHDSATLMQLHQAGYFLDVHTMSADLSTNLDATKALHWAGKSGYTRALKYLLDRGVNPCAIDNEERSQKRAALHYAASGGFVEEVDILIEKGADVQALDANSWSPLHHASTGGYYRTSEALLKAGTMHSLNSFRYCRTSQALLKAGASVHSRNSFLETPLHCAARNGHIDVIKLLLDWGADKSTEDMGGFTPFGRARKANHTIEVLRLPEVKKGQYDSEIVVSLHHSASNYSENS